MKWMRTYSRYADMVIQAETSNEIAAHFPRSGAAAVFSIEPAAERQPKKAAALSARPYRGLMGFSRLCRFPVFAGWVIPKWIIYNNGFVQICTGLNCTKKGLNCQAAEKRTALMAVHAGSARFDEPGRRLAFISQFVMTRRRN